MANWNLPTVDSNYVTFVDEVKNRDVDAALMFDGAGTNLPNLTIRWNQTNSRLERLESGSWVPRVVSLSGGGTGGNTALAARTNLGAHNATNLTTGTLPIARIANGAVTNVKLASGIDAAKITVGIIPNAQLSTSETITLGGDFNGTNNVRCSRIGNVVTLTATGNLTHASSADPASGSGVIPAIYRPTENVANAYTNLSAVAVSTEGTVSLLHRNFDGSDLVITDTGTAWSISYVVV